MEVYADGRLDEQATNSASTVTRITCFSFYGATFRCGKSEIRSGVRAGDG